jgi:hypothetical protein
MLFVVKGIPSCSLRRVIAGHENYRDRIVWSIDPGA